MDFVQKTNWVDAPSTATPITAAQLLRMEAGIAEGARDSSETQRGNVELATAAEMTAGTDLVRVPSVKRVFDYVAATVVGIGGVTQQYVLDRVSAPFALLSTATGMIPLTVKALAGQTANLFNVKNENDVIIASVDNNGQITAGILSGGGMIKAKARGTSIPLIRVQSLNGQTNNVIILEDYVGDNKFTVAPDGTVNGLNVGSPPGTTIDYMPTVVLDLNETPPNGLIDGAIILRRPT